jgi:hypothetical protein
MMKSVQGLILGAFLTLPLIVEAQVPVWTNVYNGIAAGIALGPDGTIYVAGYAGNYSTIKYSQAGTALWTNTYNGPTNVAPPEAYGLSVDKDGNCYVTGESEPPNRDYLTIKYSSSGVPLWTNRYDGGVWSDMGLRVLVDTNSNVFVAGTTWSGTNYDYTTIAYSTEGVALWTNTYNGPGDKDDRVTTAAVGANGNVYVTGKSYGSNNTIDYATVAYSSAGAVLWTNRYLGSPSGIAVDGTGNVFVTGNSSFDYATIAYSSVGVPLWTNRYDGDEATALCVDTLGNVYVTGNSHRPGGSSDYTTIAYNNAGTPLWTNHYTGPPNDRDYATAITVDLSGTVFVTGYSYNSEATSYDYATIAYSQTGIPLWTNRYGGPGSTYDRALAIAADQNGNVYVTGGPNFATIRYSKAQIDPMLRAAVSGSDVILSWPSAFSGFILQFKEDIALNNVWSNFNGQINDNGTSKTALVPLGPGKQFFRLKK